MECDSAHEAISAQIDGEDPGVPADALEAHIAGCAGCQGWRQRAHSVTRRARLGGPFLDHDLTARVLAATSPPLAGDRRRPARRAGLMGGQAVGADGAQHLIAVAGAILLFWQARAATHGTAPDAASRAVADNRAAAARPDGAGSPRPGHDGASQEVIA
jgi:hypothetical protein